MSPRPRRRRAPVLFGCDVEEVLDPAPGNVRSADRGLRAEGLDRDQQSDGDAHTLCWPGKQAGTGVTMDQTRGSRRALEGRRRVALNARPGACCMAVIVPPGYDFRLRSSAACAVCGRAVPLKNSACLPWGLQAAAVSAGPPVVTEVDLGRVTGHQ